jgi:hypothetical protein
MRELLVPTLSVTRLKEHVAVRNLAPGEVDGGEHAVGVELGPGMTGSLVETVAMGDVASAPEGS